MKLLATDQEQHAPYAKTKNQTRSTNERSGSVNYTIPITFCPRLPTY